jgi:hypothetical protein
MTTIAWDGKEMTDCTMLVVSDGVITRHFSDSENPVEIETSYWAEGSRADYALGVMAHVRWILIPALALTLTW